MAAIAVFMMAGTAVAMENVAVVERNVTVEATDNVADKLLALIKGYVKKIDATASKESFEKVYENFQTEMTEFAEKNAAEISTFDESLTEAQKKKYEEELGKVLKQFEKAVEKKAMQFLGE